jgi:predicted Zn-dependent peptidase
MPIIGTEKNILNFSQKDLFSFVDEKYGFNNLLIAASGAIDHNSLLKLADKYIIKNFGIKNIKRKEALPVYSQNQYLTKEIQQVHIIIGRPSYGYKDLKRIKLNVLSQILGEGSSSRLFQTLREKNGIAYQLNSFLNSFYDVSSFGIYLSTNDKQASKAEDLIYNELKKLREKPVPHKELQRAKESIKGNLLFTLESTTSRMFRMANSEIYFNRLVTVDEIIKHIDSTSSDDILEIANEVLQEDTLSKVVISSKDSFVKTAA